MEVLRNLHGLINRIPQSILELLIVIAIVRIYFQFQPADKLRSELIDRIWGFFTVFIFVTRFSGIILYPGTLRNMNIFTFLAQPPQNGWVLGLISALVYLVWSLRKAQLLHRLTLYLIAESILWAGLGVFAYGSLLNMAPYRNQDLLRLTLVIVLLATTRSQRLQPFWSGHPARLWLAIGISMLATSAVIPIIDRWWIFGWEQWVDTVVILGAVLSEGIEDART